MGVVFIIFNNKNIKIPTRIKRKISTRNNHAQKNIPPRNLNALPLLPHLSNMIHQPISSKMYYLIHWIRFKIVRLREKLV